ncbi:MAG: prepilin-type N-terminal cleavage/methylation domain-containing protein [Desulfovermiculus sp.]|nr:prepilin-type N-terminal cleavage/methylation domain-containing protein [Desulfovermiculus sp.]
MPEILRGKKPYPTKSLRAGNNAGFTLLEMIVSMTILSMVVLVVYVAFSMGVDVWKRMQGHKSTEQRRAVAIRLLKEDFRNIRPYTWQGEEGTYAFYTGGPQSVFYVTTNALGTSQGQGRALFFTCLFVHSTPENGLGLYIYKTGVPSRDILDLVRDFRSGGDMHRENYTLPADILDQSVLVLEDLEEGAFWYQAQAYPVFSGVKAEGKASSQEDDSKLLAESEWVDNDLPGQMSFRAHKGEDVFLVHTILSEQPVLNR